MNHLIRSLLERNAINETTIITASYKNKDNNGRIRQYKDNFYLENLVETQGDWILHVKKVIGQDGLQVRAQDILALDGMTLERYVDVYDINLDGSAKKMGKKRGRKPKIKV